MRRGAVAANAVTCHPPGHLGSRCLTVLCRQSGIISSTSNHKQQQWQQQPQRSQQPGKSGHSNRKDSAQHTTRPGPNAWDNPRQQYYSSRTSRPAAPTGPTAAHPHNGPPGRKQTGPSAAADFSSIKHLQLDQLWQLLEQHAASMQAATLVAVQLRLAKLRPGPRAWQRQELLGLIWAHLQPKLSDCKVHELALLLWAAAKLGHDDAGMYIETLEQLLQPKVLQGLEPRHLSNVIYALAAVPPAIQRQIGGAAAVRDVLPVLMQPEKLAAANTQDISNVLWALANLGPAALGPLSSSGQLQATLQQLLHRLEGQLDQAAPQAVSNTIWALAKLNFQFSQQQLLQLLQQLLAQPDRISSQDASSCLWALATMQLPVLQDLLQQLVRTDQQPRHHQQQRQPGELLQQQQQKKHQELMHAAALQLLACVAEPGQGRTNCQSLSLGLWAAAKMGVVVPRRQVQQLLDVFMQLCSRATAQDISNFVWGIATLQQTALQQLQQQGVAPPALLLQQQQADVLLSVAAAGVQQAECQAISNTLWAVAKLGLRVSEQELQTLMSVLAGRAASGEVSSQSLANTLWALAVLQGAAAATQQLQEPQQQQQQGTECWPQRYVRPLVEALVSQVNQCTTQEVANSFWAMAKLGYQVSPVDSHIMLARATSGLPLPQSFSLQEQQQQEPAAQYDLGAMAVVDMSHALQEYQQAIGAAEVTTSVKQNQHAAQQPAQPPAASTWEQQQRQQQQPQQQLIKVQEASNLLWALATVQQQHVPVAAGGAASWPLLLLLSPVQQLLGVVAAGLADIGEQELCNAFWAAARVEPCVLPQPLLTQKAQAGIADKIPSMTLQGVSNMAYALGQLGATEATQLLVVLLQHGLHLAQQHSSRLSTLSRGASMEPIGARDDSSMRLCQSLAIMCWSAAVLGLEGHPELLLSLAALCSRHWDRMHAADMCQLYMLHLCLQLQQQQHQAAAAEQHWEDAGTESGNALPAGAGTSLKPNRARKNSSSSRGAKVRKKTGQCGEQQPGGFPTLQQGMQDAGAAAAATGLRACLTEQQLQQCHAAWLQRHDQYDIQTPNIPAAAGAVAASASASLAAKPGFVFQRKVFVAAQQLQGLAGPPVFEAPSADHLFSIDICAELLDGRKLAIEVDGPTHFRLPDKGLTGTTLFRNRQLEARGYTVVPVPFFGWNKAVEKLKPLLGQQQMQKQQAGQGGQMEGEWVAEGRMGVPYLQSLVDAAVMTCRGPAQQPTAAAAREAHAVAWLKEDTAKLPTEKLPADRPNRRRRRLPRNGGSS